MGSVWQSRRAPAAKAFPIRPIPAQRVAAGSSGCLPCGDGAFLPLYFRERHGPCRGPGPRVFAASAPELRIVGRPSRPVLLAENRVASRGKKEKTRRAARQCWCNVKKSSNFPSSLTLMSKRPEHFTREADLPPRLGRNMVARRVFVKCTRRYSNEKR